MRTDIKTAKVYLVAILAFSITLFIFIIIYKNRYLFSPYSLQNLLFRSSENQQSQTQFSVESLGAAEKDTQDLEIHELSAFTHQAGNSYQLIVFVKRESGFLPERLYLIEKGTNQLIGHSQISLSRFQSGCREIFSPSIIAKYETEFFKIDGKLPFPEKDPALKNNFLTLIVYQDKTGQRYFTQKEVTKICQVMME